MQNFLRHELVKFKVHLLKYVSLADLDGSPSIRSSSAGSLKPQALGKEAEKLVKSFILIDLPAH